jgi:hypothetical protein
MPLEISSLGIMLFGARKVVAQICQMISIILAR